MNSWSGHKPKKTNLENRGGIPAPKFTAGILRFSPVIFFAACFLGAGIWRATASGSAWLDLFLISTALIATLLTVNQRLPLQNVVGLIVTVAVFWWATLLIAKVSGVFFYPPLFNFHFYREYEFGLFWAVGLINARGIAQLILYRWRKGANYGLWLIAASSWLLVIEDPGARLHLVYFGEKFFFAAIVLGAATPWFIEKKRIEPKRDFQPLFIVLLLWFW